MGQKILNELKKCAAENGRVLICVNGGTRMALENEPPILNKLCRGLLASTLNK